VANALEARALVYLKLGQLDKAIADYDAALKTNPELAGPLYGRGMAKLRTGDVAGGDADTASAKAGVQRSPRRENSSRQVEYHQLSDWPPARTTRQE
jgi:tetratricopeptide (TPR) repeat protein